MIGSAGILAADLVVNARNPTAHCPAQCARFIRMGPSGPLIFQFFAAAAQLQA